MLFVILSFVVFRVTRFILHDTLIEAQRVWVLRKVNKAKPHTEMIAGEQVTTGYFIPAWRRKLTELLQCFWCCSVWVAAATVFVVHFWYSIPIPWIYFTALSGAAVLIADHVEGS